MSNPEVMIYSAGLCMCSVCAPKDMPVDQVELQTNAQLPTGISSRWSLHDEAFAGGEPNPSPCNHDPGRLHYLMSC